MKQKEYLKIKPRLHKDSAGLWWKIKLPMYPPINKPTVKLTEKPIPHTQNMEHPKITLKVPIPESSSIHDKIIPKPDYAIPPTSHRRWFKF